MDFQEWCLKVDARSSWMPDDSTCFPKFGMYNEITEQFVSNRDDKEGLRLDSMDQLSLASPHTRLVPWFEQVTCLIWEAVCLVAPFSGMFTTMFRNVKPKLLPLS